MRQTGPVTSASEKYEGGVAPGELAAQTKAVLGKAARQDRAHDEQHRADGNGADQRSQGDPGSRPCPKRALWSSATIGNPCIHPGDATHDPAKSAFRWRAKLATQRDGNACHRLSRLMARRGGHKTRDVKPVSRPGRADRPRCGASGAWGRVQSPLLPPVSTVNRKIAVRRQAGMRGRETPARDRPDRPACRPPGSGRKRGPGATSAVSRSATAR